MVSLYRPEPEDMWFRQKMLSDPDTMSYNEAWGGTIPFPESRWKDWYAHWVLNTEGKRFYRYLIDENGSFLGEAAYHLDEEHGIYVADIIVYSLYRGRGIGSAGLRLLCSHAFDSGIDLIYDDIASGNTAIKMFLNFGFKEVMRSEKTILLEKDLIAEAGTCLYRDGGTALYVRDGSVFFTDSGRRYRLSSSPYEPCLYMDRVPDGGQTVIHNAFSVAELTDAAQAGKKITLISGNSYDVPVICSLLAAASELAPGEYGADYIECLRFMKILAASGAVSADTAADLALCGLANHRIMDRMIHSKYVRRTEDERYFLTGRTFRH